MLLGILFFLSTFFNPVFQDKKFNKDNFISKIKLDAETYNINDSFVNDILFVWQSKLSLNEKNKLIEILNGITTNKNDSYNSQYFSFLDYVTLLYDSNVTLSSNFLQIISYHDEQAKLNNTSTFKFVLLAPISTPSSNITFPICGVLKFLFFIGIKPNPLTPILLPS